MKQQQIEDLKEELYYANDKVDELEDKVSILQDTLNYFKDLWQRFIKFLQDKFFSSDKYDNFINELYNEDIINDNDINTIQNKSKKKNKNDDFEL